MSAIIKKLENTSSSVAPTQARSHLAFIDGIRALAALFVVLCHSYFEPANGYYAGGLMNHLGLTYGHLAVDVFIVVSGFCLMLPIARRKDVMPPLRHFFARRAWRILPPYYAALAFSVLFIFAVAHDPTGTVWDNSLPLTGSQIIAHLLLVHDLPLGIKGGSINYPLWSIAVECQIYLLMPVVVLSLRYFGNAVTLAWTVALGILLHQVFHGHLDSARPWYLGLFTFGAVMARESWNRPCVHWRLASGVAWLAAALVIVLKGKSFFDAYACYIDTLVGIASALLIGATFTDAPARRFLLTRILSWPLLTQIGLFSYSLYLIHAPLLHAADLVFTRMFHPQPVLMFLLLLLCSPLVVVLAYLFHLMFERPFIRSPRSRSLPDAALIPSLPALDPELKSKTE